MNSEIYSKIWPEYLFNLAIKHDFKNFYPKQIFNWSQLNKDLKSYLFNFFSNSHSLRLVNKEFYTLFYKKQNSDILLKTCIFHRNDPILSDLTYNLITPKMVFELENPLFYYALKWERNVWESCPILIVFMCDRYVCNEKCICSRPEEIGSEHVESLIRFVKFYGEKILNSEEILKKINKSLLYNDNTLNFIQKLDLDPRNFFKLALDSLNFKLAFNICKKYSIKNLSDDEICELISIDTEGENTFEIMEMFNFDKLKVLRKILYDYKKFKIAKNIILSIEYFDYKIFSQFIEKNKLNEINIFLMDIDHKPLKDFYMMYKTKLSDFDKAYAICEGFLPYDYNFLIHYSYKNIKILNCIIKNADEEEILKQASFNYYDLKTKIYFINLILETLKIKYFKTYKKEAVKIVIHTIKIDINFLRYNSEFFFSTIKFIDFDFSFEEKKDLLHLLVSNSLYFIYLHELTEETFYHVIRNLNLYSLEKNHIDLLLSIALKKEDEYVLDKFFHFFKNREEELKEKINSYLKNN